MMIHRFLGGPDGRSVWRALRLGRRCGWVGGLVAVWGVMVGLAGVPACARADPAHQHGVARLDVAVEAGRITIGLDTPLDNLLGFERAPRTEAERRQADAVVARLKDAEAVFRIDPAAGCQRAEVSLRSAALQLGAAPVAASGHADLEGSFTFAWRDAARAAFIDVGLFEFKRLTRLEVQVAGPQRQFKRQLKPTAARLTVTP